MLGWFGPKYVTYICNVKFDSQNQLRGLGSESHERILLVHSHTYSQSTLCTKAHLYQSTSLKHIVVWMYNFRPIKIGYLQKYCK
jgi:hypothetical protein